jgi:hypothetical protein
MTPRASPQALVIGVVLATLTMGSAANAAVITFNLTTEFSGGTAPVGSTPWATATFDDSFGGANTARLTMMAGNLSGTEFISAWYFNLNPALRVFDIQSDIQWGNGYQHQYRRECVSSRRRRLLRYSVQL